MPTSVPLSGKAVLTLVLGLLSLASGLLAMPSGSELFLRGVMVFWVGSLALGILCWVESKRVPGKRRGQALAGWGVGVATVALGLGFCMVPPVWLVRDTSFRMISANNLHRIVLAMQQYARDHRGRLPPAALRDEQGRPLLSWRVLLLPYLGEEGLYQEFRLDEPWDSEHNLALLPRMPKVYAVPPGLWVDVRDGPGRTFYQVFTGRGTAFDGPEGLRLPEGFPDGPSNTILVVEAGAPVPWTSPEDLAYDADRPLPPLGGIFAGQGRFRLYGGTRIKGFNVGLADGSVRFIYPPLISEVTLRGAITRNDGRSLGSDW